MLSKIILQLTKQKALTAGKLDALKRRISAEHKHPAPSTAELLSAYRQLVRTKKIRPNLMLEKLLKKRGVRTLSGVAIVTVLTKPWKCPGRCIYCPTQAGMPKSYLKNEPAAQRAYFNKFSPYQQVISRLQTLYNNGHPTDKIELIVKGGSWNAYPKSYQVWFITECFRAANNFGKNYKLQITNVKQNPNDKIQNLLRKQKKNETAKCRIVGLTLETRPDMVNPKTILEMRQLGCTRVELGVQHTDDKILKLIHRGHTLAEVKRATALLRQAGFKIDYHLMPQLPGSTPKKDFAMIEKIFADPNLRPDMIKIYPCTVVPGSTLQNWHKQGRYKPYSTKKLIDLLIKVKSQLIPYYCRISRLIRDIPSTEIVAGNRVTNLREIIQAEMKKKNLKCKCLRCREIGHVCHPERSEGSLQHTRDSSACGLRMTTRVFDEKYEASGGIEHFLSIEDKQRNIVFAFCRLRLDSNGLYQAYIRELHTYGQMLGLGAKEKKANQHTGFGKKLLAEAEKIAKKSNVKKLAVISGIGVRNYYRRLGYQLESTYLVKKLK